MIFIFTTISWCLTTPPTISHMEMVTHSMYFQHRNDSKTSTLFKACRLRFEKHGSLTIISMLKIHAMGHHFHVGNCRGCGQTSHAKRRKLTPRIYSQLWRVDRRSQKISAVWSKRLQQNRSTFCRFTGSAALAKTLCSTFCQQEICGRKNFCGNKFLQAGCLIAKTAKISASQKFSTIR